MAEDAMPSEWCMPSEVAETAGDDASFGRQTRPAADLTNEEAAVVLKTMKAGIKPDLSRYGYRAVKRAFDVVASTCAIALLLAPAAILSAVICIKSPGAGPLYSQFRVGRLNRDGSYRLFRMWKFRSMGPDADQMLDKLKDLNEADGPMFKIREDPRIIPGVGKFIRKHSMASVIIGTPGAGEPTNSLSSAAKTSFDQQFYDRRPEVSPATQSIIPAPNSCLFTFFGGSRKAQYELEARADGADQGGSPWRGKASSSMIEKGAYCLTPALGVAA